MKDGGDAFPCYVGNDGAERGMTLRDYFAGQALIGWETATWTDFQQLAQKCYAIADAMLAERENV